MRQQKINVMQGGYELPTNALLQHLPTSIGHYSH